MLNQKQKHQLYQCKNSDELLMMLSEHGIDILSVIKKNLVSPDDNVGVIVVGSIPEQTATDGSDIDIKVLVDEPSCIIQNQNNINIDFGFTKEILLYEGGIEINIEFNCKTELGHLVESLINLAPALYNPADLKTLPILTKESIQFIHKLKNCWILAGEDVVNVWQDEFLVDVIPLYVCVRNFMEAVEMYEDSMGTLSRESETYFHSAQITVKHGLLAILAKEGYTGQNEKWMFDWCNALEGNKIKQIINTGKALYLIDFNSINQSLEERGKYLDKVKGFITDVKTHICEDQSISKAISYLTETISYVDY